MEPATYDFYNCQVGGMSPLDLSQPQPDGPNVMDRYNLWDDDAEEILLDLGFGCDEPDLMGHVPARFLSNQSKARGMTLQLFIEAQKNRLNSENPEFHTSIRQLEVLQMVNMKFSSLAGSSSSLLKTTLGKHVPSDVQERKRHIGMLYRRASKKLLGQIQNTSSHDIKILAASSPSSVPTESLQFTSSSVEEKVQDKTFKSGLMETVCQSHLTKEEEASSEGQSQLQEVSSMQKHQPGTEGTLAADSDLRRNGTPRQVFSGVLVWNTDTQSGEKPGSSPPSLLSFSATASVIDRHLPAFGYYSPEFLISRVHRESKNSSNDLDSQSLLLGCESSVDDSDGESEDAEAFFQQLDADGRVHWAEHIQVTPVHEEFGSCEDLSPGDSDDQHFLSSTSMSSSSTISATEQISKNTTLLSNNLSSWIVEPLPSPSANQDFKQSNHSISFPSSHIIKRKDVPYSTESKPVNPLHNVRLNLSTPFQAVRSWTELRIHLNAKKILHGSVHTFPNHWNLTDTEQTTTPSRFLMSSKWHSHEGILTAIEKNNTSLNPRHWTDDQKERDAKENGVLSCDCSRARGGRSKEGIKPANSPNAADEFKKTILCLQRFCSVLGNMEDQISVDQSEVYSILSNADRENIRHIEKLRFAVKMEAVELEMQLKEQFHQDNEILKMSMLQLLDEQSRFCSQVSLPGSVPKRPV
ncbi:uncharacterized protein itprid1 [Menidia menidia]